MLSWISYEVQPPLQRKNPLWLHRNWHTRKLKCFPLKLKWKTRKEDKSKNTLLYYTIVMNQVQNVCAQKRNLNAPRCRRVKKSRAAEIDRYASVFPSTKFDFTVRPFRRCVVGLKRCLGTAT